jgi:hypothetical protein
MVTDGHENHGTDGCLKMNESVSSCTIYIIDGVFEAIGNINQTWLSGGFSKV